VGVSLGDAEQTVGVQPGVHARDYGHLEDRRRIQVSLVEILSIAGVVCQQVVSGRHQVLLEGA
jgi:tRNA splicing ligase